MSAAAAFTRLDGLETVPQALRGAVIAIGNFDGFHRGHQHVFETAQTMARERGVPALILTFEPHPRDVFAPEPFLHRLTGPDEKTLLARALGFEGIAILTFDRELAGLAPEAFVQRHLIEALGVSGVVVGADFHFGKARAGTPDFLRQQGQRHGFAVTVLDMLDEGEDTISSSRIRQALAAGEIVSANTLLGYRHFFSGLVEEGDRRGRELGYPTANIAVPPTNGLRQGVYAVRVGLGDALHDGLAAFGKPMFGDAPPPFETFIFDFDRDIYGQPITVALLDFLRGQEKFDSLEALIAQMDRDADAARARLSRTRPLSRLDAALGFVVG